MITTYFRSSSLNNWKYCELQYFMTYVLGHYSPSGKKADLGTITHAVFETLAICKKRTQFNKRSKMKITQEPLGDFSFSEDELFTDDFVNKVLDRSFEFYKSNSKHNEFNEKDYQFCYKMVWDTLAYNKGQFDPRNRKIIDTEPHFDIPINEPWAKFTFDGPDGPISGNLAIKGTIDLVTELPDGTIEVIDWKTGQRLDWATGERKDYDKLMKDTQLLLYHYAIGKLYPKYRYTLMTIFFCRDGGPFTLAFDKDDDEYFLNNTLKSMFEEIRANQKPKPVSQDRNSFKCQKLCHYYKTNWPGTEKTMCHHIEDQIKTIGMQKTVETCTRPGFVIGTYKDPGAVE
jgi:hypothetical protein